MNQQQSIYSNRRNVLYIGNNTSVLMELIHMPKKNMDLFQNKSFAKAIEWLGNSKYLPDFILMDASSPQEDMVRFFELLNKRVPKGIRVPVILFSSNLETVSLPVIVKQKVVFVLPYDLNVRQRDLLYRTVGSFDACKWGDTQVGMQKMLPENPYYLRGAS